MAAPLRWPERDEHDRWVARADVRAAYRVASRCSAIFFTTVFDMPNTKSIGEISEAIVLAEYTLAAWAERIGVQEVSSR
jgi:hypothetical protein